MTRNEVQAIHSINKSGEKRRERERGEWRRRRKNRIENAIVVQSGKHLVFNLDQLLRIAMANARTYFIVP